MAPIDLIPIGVASIASFAAYWSNRSANRATTTNTQIGGRLDAEKEAYERARQFDLETIKRQDTELRELRTQVRELTIEVARLTGSKYGDAHGSSSSGLGGSG